MTKQLRDHRDFTSEVCLIKNASVLIAKAFFFCNTRALCEAPVSNNA